VSADRLDFRHPQEKRQAARAAYQAHGSYRKAAAALGVGRSTLHGWLQGDELGTDATGQPDVQTEPVDGDLTPQTEAELDAEGQETAQQASELSQTTVEAPGAIPAVLQHLTDPLYLQAFRRYVSALANGTHHVYAVQTAQGVHPDFDISPQDQQRVGDAVGRLMLSEGGHDYLMFAAEPPGYIKALYSDYAMGSADATDLAGMLLELKTRAYLAGINTQLAAQGRAPVRGITDPAVLSSLRDESTAVAKQIAETWNRDAASAVGARWLEVAPGTRMRGEAILTPEERKVAVRGAMDDWLQGRRDWKASMWANTEAGRSYGAASKAFYSRNRDAGDTAHVEPYAAECTGCVELVALGEVPAEIAMLTDLPLHNSCLVGETPVAPIGVLIVASRAQYAGPLVTVTTEGGRTFTATPNHPVLTAQGWVTAGLVAVGDDVYHAQSPQVAIAEVFSTTTGQRSLPVNVSREEFHGDGAAMGELVVASAVHTARRSTEDALPAETTVDRVLRVDRTDAWSGAVYNLETSSGVFLADGIVTHNCSHLWAWSVVAWDDAADGPLWAAQGDAASVDEGAA
jgi:hypothetical protein